MLIPRACMGDEASLHHDTLLFLFLTERKCLKTDSLQRRKTPSGREVKKGEPSNRIGPVLKVYVYMIMFVSIQTSGEASQATRDPAKIR